MRVKPIKELILGIIEDRKRKLNAEIEDLRRRQREDEYVFGCGGAYRRKEAAIARREEQLEELEYTRMQVKGLVELKEEFYYKLYCKECGNTFTSKQKPSGDYHECPACKRAFYDNTPQQYKRLAGREDWQRKW